MADTPAAAGVCSLESLPDDVLVRVLGLLQPCQLHWTERVNKRFRNIVVQYNLWRSHCARGCSNFEETVHDVDIQSLQQIITDLQEMAAAEDKALAQPPSSLSSTVMQHLRNTKLLPGSSPVLRSDSDLQHSKPPITVTPFWGPGLSSAASQTSPAASSSTYASLEGDHSDQDPPRPRSYSRDGNLSTSRDNSREGSMHGGNNLWQFNFSITREVLRSMFYKRLCWRLGAQPAQESLIAKALQASSTDNVEESIQNVLRPDTRRIALWVTYSYWSSAASEDVNSIETLDFELAHPLCLVSEVLIRPFKADFQEGSPIYPAKQVRFHFGAMGTQPQTDSPAEFQALYSSPVYPMQHTNDLQAFVLPSVMAVGGAMRVELIGRMQRQPAPADNRFYTCIDYVKLVGAPLYGFEPCDGLLALAPSQAGMTANASEGSWKAERRRPEMGRHLSSSQAVGADAASDDEDGQHGLHGDSDDGDFAQEQAFLSDADTDSSYDEGHVNAAAGHGAGFILGQQLAMHPIDHFAGALDPHDHDGEYPVMYD